MTQTVDHIALLPAYLAAGTAVLVLMIDLLLARRQATIAATALGAAGTTLVAILSTRDVPRATFCTEVGCSYLAGNRAALVATLFGLLTLGALALATPILRSGPVPVGEYCFLLASSMTGGVMLGAAGDLITLIVALETLTLPLYVLVGLRRGSRASAEAAMTFFLASVLATTITLLGAALLYAVTGAVHLGHLGEVLARRADLRELALTPVAVVLLVVGLAFKIAAVPLHAYVPTTYDGAPVPVAAYLSTAAKLGGVVALLAVVGPVLPADLTGPALALLAVLTMTVGNLVALRQRRMVRLLAWSSIAQAGYILAPLGAFAMAAGRTSEAQADAVAATLAYAVFFILLELAAFAGVVALRPPGADGGTVEELRGAARRHPLTGGALTLALIGLAGLPPGLAGLFAKVVVVRSLLDGDAAWLAIVVALNAVIGLAYYLRVAVTLYDPAHAEADTSAVPGSGPSLVATAGHDATALRVSAWPVTAVLAIATVIAVVVGFAPQLVLTAVR